MFRRKGADQPENNREAAEQLAAQGHCYIDYDDLMQIESFPKSRRAFIKMLFRNFGENFQKGLPWNISLMVLVSLALFVGMVFYTAIIVDSVFMTDENTGFMNISAYIAPGILYGGGEIRGVSHFYSDHNNLFLIVPLYGLVAIWIQSFFRTVFSRDGIKKLLINLKNSRSNTANYREVVGNAGNRLHIVMIIAYLLGFFIMSPYTMLLLAILLWFSYLKNTESVWIAGVGTFLASGQIKRKRKPVSFAKIALVLLGLSRGFLVYSLVSFVLLVTVRYSIYARAVITLGMIALHILMMLKNKNVTALLMTVSVLAGMTLSGYSILADDGGWTESAGNLMEWLQNAGTKIIGALGLSGALGAVLGMLGNLVAGGVFGHFGLDAPMKMGALLAGFGHPRGSDAANLAFSKAAINMAFGNVSPLGDMINGMVGDIHNGLSGNTGGVGSSGDTGSSSGSGDSSFGDYGGIDPNRDRQRNPWDD